MKYILCLLLCLSMFGCTTRQTTIDNQEYKIVKQKSYLGYLQDEDGEMVLPLNTDCYLTNVRSDLKEEMTSTASLLLFKYHKLLDSHRYYKDEEGNRIINLRIVNESFNNEVIIDEVLYNAIKESIEISKLTKGYFNPTVGKVSDVYDGKFTSYYTVNEDPDKDSLDAALETVVPYEELDNHIILNDDNSSVTLIPYNDLEFEIDLGAFSKGYVSELIYKELIKYKSSFILNCGSSSMITYNEPSENINWTIGFKTPDNPEATLYATSTNNTALSTSGDYEQYYFLEDGTRRHHILNPFTGVSENYYRSIVLSTEKKAGLIDAFTTALFSIENVNDAINMIKEVEDYYDIKINYCFIKDGYKLITNSNNKELFIDQYTSSEVKEIEIID